MLYCESLQKRNFLEFFNDFVTHYFKAKRCWSFDDVKGQLALFFAVARSWVQKELILKTSKIHRKLKKIATTIAVVIRKRDLYKRKTFRGIVYIERKTMKLKFTRIALKCASERNGD